MTFVRNFPVNVAVNTDTQVPVYADTRMYKDPHVIHCLHKLPVFGTCAASTAGTESVQPIGPRPMAQHRSQYFLPVYGDGYTHVISYICMK